MIESLLFTIALTIGGTCEKRTPDVFEVPSLDLESGHQICNSNFRDPHEPLQSDAILRFYDDNSSDLLSKRDGLGERKLMAVSSVSDVEPANNTWNIATKFDFDGSANIFGKLHVNSGWDQFWHNLPEKDEDYYRFTLKEGHRVTFYIMGPSVYHYELLRFGETPIHWGEMQSGFTEMDLQPATYYVHVYADRRQDISNEDYSISFTSRRAVLPGSVKINDELMANYKVAIWRNEKWFYNVPADAKGGTALRTRVIENARITSDRGFVDPLFCEELPDGLPDRKEESFLSHIIYLWGKEAHTYVYDLSDKILDLLEAGANSSSYDTFALDFGIASGSLLLSILGIHGVGTPALAIASCLIGAADVIKLIYGHVMGERLHKGKELDVARDAFRELRHATDPDMNPNLIVRIPVYTNVNRVFDYSGQNKITTRFEIEHSISLYSKEDYEHEFPEDYYKHRDAIFPSVVDFVKGRDTRKEFGTITLYHSADSLSLLEP